jgi:hypothetical protein
MAGEREGHLLQPTALVNEAFLRLVNLHQIRWQNQAHFFAMAARVIGCCANCRGNARSRKAKSSPDVVVPLEGRGRAARKRLIARQFANR